MNAELEQKVSTSEISFNDLEKELEEIESQFLKLAVFVGDDLTFRLLEAKKRRIQRHQEREALVKKCHPDGNHWPPHDECPACQKIFQRLENEARAELGEVAKDQKKLEDKVVEIFERKYIKPILDYCI